jgi:hypothetical protein
MTGLKHNHERSILQTKKIQKKRKKLHFEIQSTTTVPIFHFFFSVNIQILTELLADLLHAVNTRHESDVLVLH